MQPTPDSETQDRLLSAAERLVVLQGPNSFRMDDLAHEVGMSKKTIYQIIPGKEALLEKVFLGFVAYMRKNTSAIISNQDLKFQDRSSQLFLEISRTLSRINSNVMKELQRYYPNIFNNIQQVRRKFLPEMISELIRQGQAENMIKKDIDTQFFCEAYLQAVQGLLSPENQQFYPIPLNEIPLKLSLTFFEGIRDNDYSGPLITPFKNVNQ